MYCKPILFASNQLLPNRSFDFDTWGGYGMSIKKYVCRFGQPLLTQSKHVSYSYTVNPVEQVMYEYGCISSDGAIEVL